MQKQDNSKAYILFVSLLIGIIAGFLVCYELHNEWMDDHIKNGYITHNGVVYIITKK